MHALHLNFETYGTMTATAAPMFNDGWICICIDTSIATTDTPRLHRTWPWTSEQMCFVIWFVMIIFYTNTHLCTLHNHPSSHDCFLSSHSISTIEFEHYLYINGRTHFITNWIHSARLVCPLAPSVVSSHTHTMLTLFNCYLSLGLLFDLWQ